MKAHALKTWPESFNPIVVGAKTADWRKDDRGIEVGDVIIFKEWEPQTQLFTGREVVADVTHVLRMRFGVPEGYVMISFDLHEAPGIRVAAKDALDFIEARCRNVASGEWEDEDAEEVAGNLARALGA